MHGRQITLDRIKQRSSFPFFVFSRQELIFFFVILLLGMIIGAVLLTIMTAKYVDELVLENKELKIIISDQEKQLGQLDKQYKKRMIIQRIAPYLDTDINKHTQQEIIKKIRNLLAGLIGKDIVEIDPLLLRDIINEASIIVEDRVYQLNLSYLVVSDELRLYLIISDYKENSEKE